MKTRVSLFYLLLSPLLFVSALIGVAVGSTSIGWRSVLAVVGLKLLPHGWVDAARVTPADQVIIWLIRIPRVRDCFDFFNLDAFGT